MEQKWMLLDMHTHSEYSRRNNVWNKLKLKSSHYPFWIKVKE